MLSRLTVMSSQGICARGPIHLGADLLHLSAPVGRAPRCPNEPDDVRAIQRALNRFAPEEGGPLVPLDPDGKLGHFTSEAIWHFQKKWSLFPKGRKEPDGVVDRDGGTIRRLQRGPGTPGDLPTRFAAYLPRVGQAILATRALLEAARTHFTLRRGGGSIPGLATLGEAAVRKVDRHFHVLKLPSALVRLQQIDAIYANMQTAIGYVPQGVVLALEEPPRFAQGAIMFTFAGGYNRTLRFGRYEDLSMGSIYLCPRARTLGADSFAYAMLHELAHFVSSPNDPVDDVAYFHRTPQLYRTLGSEPALHNADSYAQLAFEAIGNPDFTLD